MVTETTFTLTATPQVLTTAGRFKSVVVSNVGTTSIYVGGDDVTVPLGLEIPAAQAYTIDLRQGDALYGTCATSGTALLLDMEDPSGSPAPARLGIAISDPTDHSAPTLSSGSVDGTSVTLTFSETLVGTVPAGSAFTVTGAGSGAHSVTGVVVIVNDVVTLQLASAVFPAEAVVVAYTKPGTNQLRDASGNQTASFSNRAINNNTAGSFPAGGSVAVATDGGDLPADPSDGDIAIIRLGTYPNIHEEVLTWNASSAAWIGEEHEVMTGNDTWSMDLGNKSGAKMLDWCFFNNPNPNSRPVYGLTDGGALNLDLSNFDPGTHTGVITCVTVAGFTTSGTVLLRDNIITYTGKSGATLTGCAVLAGGSRGSIPDNTDIVQGFSGGYGIVSEVVVFAGELYAAGLRLQEQMVALMNGDGTHALTVAPYWYEYDNGDGSIAIAEPPVGGLGFGASLVGGTAAGGTKPTEREFTYKTNSWSNLGIIPTKRYTYPRLYGKMGAGSTDTGQILDPTYRVRWVYTP